MYGTSF